MQPLTSPFRRSQRMRKTGIGNAPVKGFEVFPCSVCSVGLWEVRPLFTEWCRLQAGMRPEFRDTNPSWTSILFSN